MPKCDLEFSTCHRCRPSAGSLFHSMEQNKTKKFRPIDWDCDEIEFFIFHHRDPILQLPLNINERQRWASHDLFINEDENKSRLYVVAGSRTGGWKGEVCWIVSTIVSKELLTV